MKIKRQSKIIELIKNHEIETQEDLCEKLNDLGFNVTQATVSRDIREMKITKATDENGNQRYVILASADLQFNDRFLKIFKNGILNFDYAGNIIVVKTLEGMAMAVASCIDYLSELSVVGLLGCIAGDDAIFCVAKSEAQAIEAINKMKEILRKN